jgi:hypothetical protein
MRRKTLIPVCILTACVLMQSRTFGQQCTTPSTGATINDTGATQIYVDAVNGTDSSSCGASASPCKSITQGLTQATGYTVVDMIVNPGTYRESLSLPNQFGESSPRTLVIEAATSGTAIIDGAAQWTGWSSNGDGTYSLAWPNTWGYAAQPFTASGGPAIGCLGLRREMVFINGTQLTQMLQGPLTQAGTFFVVDGQGDSNPGDSCPTLSGDSNVITVYPPSGTDISSADVEVAVQDNLFTTAGTGAQNLELKGLVFQHDNNGANNSGYSAIHISGNNVNNQGANILLDTVVARYNNWQGLDLSANLNITVRNSTFTWNGENGVEIYQPLNFLFTGNIVTYNNWRGYAGGLTGWDADGMKAVKAHFMEVDNSSFNNNFTGGLWFDTDNENICITGDSFNQNTTNGLYFEATQGPALVYQSVSYKNLGQGLQTANSSGITVRQSTVYDNGANALFIGGSTTVRDVYDWQVSGVEYQLLAQNWVLDGVNFATGPDTASGSNLIGTSLSTITPFTSTLLSNYNDWYAPNNATPFDVPGHGNYNLSGWQGYTGQDANSTQTAVTSDALPSATTCIGVDCGGGILLTIASVDAGEKYKLLSGTELAQSFVVPSGTNSLSQILIGLARCCSDGTDHATTVHVRSTLTGTDIWSATFTPTVNSTSYESPSFVNVPVTSGISLTSGDTYYLVVDTTNSNSKDYYYLGVAENQIYAAGYFYDNSAKKDYSAYAILRFLEQ